MTDPSAEELRAAELRHLDRTAGWIIIVLLAIAAVFGSVLGIFLPLGLDTCDDDCRGITAGRFYFGWALAVGGPWLPAYVALLWMLVRAAAQRPTWWVPLVASAASATLWELGWWLALGSWPHP